MISTDFPQVVTKEAVTNALGYTPAGGKNLVLDSAVEVSNGAFATQTYHLSEKIELNQTYTATIWGELDSSKTEYTIYIEDQKGASFLRPVKVADGIYRATGEITSWEFDSKKEHADIIQIIPCPYGTIETGTNTIHHIKLELGTVTDPVWTPAPEDVVVRSELENKDTIIEGDYLNIVFSKYGKVCSAYASNHVDGKTKIKKEISDRTWTMLCILTEKPNHSVTFPISIFIVETATLIIGIGHVNIDGKLEIYSTAGILLPIDSQLHFNVTYICQ